MARPLLGPTTDMHGFIFTRLERFVAGSLDAGPWPALLLDAGVGERAYVPVASYPAHELRDIVVAAARRSGLGVDRVLFDFGRFLAPDLLRNYRHLLAPDWRTLDVLEHTDRVIHAAIRGTRRDATTPRIAVMRASGSAVVTYQSPHGLCAMGRGIVVGIADHFGESVSVREPFCALKGARDCTILVREVRSTERELPRL